MRCKSIISLMIGFCFCCLLASGMKNDSGLYTVLTPEQKSLVEVSDLRYNIFSDKWQYVEEGKNLNYNYFEDKWEWEE